MADRNYLIARISVFVSYARKDISKRITLINTLFDRSLDEITDIFVDENLNPGVKVDETIESQLNRSRIILLLLTPNFTSSNYCMNVELPLALRRAREGKCKLCAFILEEGNYDSILQESECLVVPKTGLLLTQIDDAKYQIETARIDLKYVVYQEYEKEHEKIEIREDGAFYGSCRLVESHWESEQKLESDRPATIRGIVAAAAISITFSLSIYFSRRPGSRQGHGIAALDPGRSQPRPDGLAAQPHRSVSPAARRPFEKRAAFTAF
ncbi:MAG: toll/interleukin-1 receptor domain-containing protein [Cyanobacteria bacterium P01_B01_bin.77]